MKTAFRRLLAAAHAFALSACMLVGGDSLVAPGGAEDFPNTVQTLGRIAVGDISSSGDWEQVQDITLPEMPEISGMDSLSVTPPLSKSAGLSKFGLFKYGAEDGLRDTAVDLNRTVQFLLYSEVRVYITHETDAFLRRDTIDCKYVGPFASPAKLDSIIRSAPLDYVKPLRAWGTTVSKLLPEWQGYRLTNLDTGKAMDLAEYTTAVTSADSTTLRKRVRIYGPGGTYDLPSQVPEEYEVLRHGPGRDTLEWTLVRDADWDRKLWGDSAKGVVDLQLKVRNPQSQPGLSRMHVFMRANFHHNATGGDSLRQLNYQEQRWLRNGGNVTFSFQGARAGGLLTPGDTARLTMDTVYALRDSSIRYTAVYNLLLGPSTERMQDHKLLGYGIAKYLRQGPMKQTLSVFAPSAPVPMGQADFEGQMSFMATYRNLDVVETQGSVTRDSLNLTVRQIKGGVASSFAVVLDAAGNLLQFTPLAVTADATGTAKRAP